MVTRREKVVEGLERCISQGLSDEADCRKCPYYQSEDRLACWIVVLQDAMELLKEQEPKNGRWERLTGMAPPEYHGHKICSVCESMAPYDPIHVGREILSKYCPGCGAKMESVASDN